MTDSLQAGGNRIAEAPNYQLPSPGSLASAQTYAGQIKNYGYGPNNRLVSVNGSRAVQYSVRYSMWSHRIVYAYQPTHLADYVHNGKGERA